MADPLQDAEIRLALLEQRVQIVESNVRDMDNDIKQLRTEMVKGFDKLLERFDSLKDEIGQTKQFGKGVYWVLGVVAAAFLAFKDQIFNSFK